MRNFNESTITDAVVDRIKDAPDARVKQISASLIANFVRHEPSKAPDGRVLDVPFFTSVYDFVLRQRA